MILQSQMTFTIATRDAYIDTQDLIIIPENVGNLSLRELHYPNNTLPVIKYYTNPDKWSNFDTAPMTHKPQLKTEMTIEGNIYCQWDGFLGDNPVREIWSGDDKTAPMPAYFLRRLAEYYFNPPTAGYIQWWPKDRTDKGYNVLLEGLTLGDDQITFDYVSLLGGYVTGNVTLTMRLIGEVV